MSDRYQEGLATGHKINEFRERLWWLHRDRLEAEIAALQQRLEEMTEARTQYFRSSEIAERKLAICQQRLEAAERVAESARSYIAIQPGPSDYPNYDIQFKRLIKALAAYDKEKETP
jgi:phosphoglycerate-specific signal transduction histidine kinase